MDNKWTVQLPINDLLQIVRMADNFSIIQKENQQLRQELDGLRRVQSEQMELLGDLRRRLSLF